MNTRWRDFLVDRGAVTANDRVLRFSTAAGHDSSLETGMIADLSHAGLLAVHGPDATKFLQGQFTNNILAVNERKAQISGYCNAKGRLLAVMYVFARAQTYYLYLPLELAAPIASRLQKYRVTAKLELRDVSDDVVRIGLAGTSCEPLLGEIFGELPATAFDAESKGSMTLIRLAGALPRYLLAGGLQELQEVWTAATARLTPVGTSRWQWLELCAGVPVILPPTQESFIPQTVNLDALNGISFTKGCYTGQEIVARVHYLGKLKQRMYLAHVAADLPLSPGDTLCAPGRGGGAGTVVTAEPDPGGGQALLAVVDVEAANGAVYLHDVGGPKLRFKKLPYEIIDCSGGGPP